MRRIGDEKTDESQINHHDSMIGPVMFKIVFKKKLQRFYVES